MITAIKNWFKARREKQFAAYLREMEQRQKEKEADELKRQEELRESARALEKEKEEARHTSDEPWIAVKSQRVVNGAMEFELDWNPAMIRFLKENGFAGDDDQIIQKYLGALYREIYEDGKNDALDILKQSPDGNAKLIPLKGSLDQLTPINTNDLSPTYQNPIIGKKLN